MKREEFLKKLKPGNTECVGSGSGADFHDLKDDVANPEAGLAIGLEVRSGYILDAIGTIYGSAGTVLRGNTRGGRSCRVVFEEGDALKSMEGVCEVSYSGNKTLSQVVIHTANGKSYGPFGDAKNGKKFRLEVPENAIFVGLYGKADNISVNRLGIIYVEGNLGSLNIPDMNELAGKLTENSNVFGGFQI